MLIVCRFIQSLVLYILHSERHGGIATAPPLRRSYSDRAVTSPRGAFQTDTNLANHRHRTRLLADCQWRCRWRCGLGRLQNTRSLTKTIPRDRRKLIKLMLRKWTFLPPRSHLIRQFVKRHLVTLRREQHVLAQWLRQHFCRDHGVHSVSIFVISECVSSLTESVWYNYIGGKPISTSQGQCVTMTPLHGQSVNRPWLMSMWETWHCQPQLLYRPKHFPDTSSAKSQHRRLQAS